MNDVLFRYHQRTNLSTRENIEYVLSHQTTKHWRLGDVEFTRYFHYKWENENGLLGALFSIAEPFDEPYQWTWDTQSYPWTINLVKPSASPSAEVRFGKNIASIEREIDPSNIVNRLYALGAGEGVNQLDIKRVNGGAEYIENAQSIAEYGLQSYIWVDRRFEDEASLLASARKFLDEWSAPKVNYAISAIELSSLSGLDIDKLTVGKVIRVVDPDVGTFNTRIVGESKADIYGAPYDVKLTLSNADETIGTTLADVERRQEINEVYAQGATNMLIYPYEDNADSDHPAVIRFKLPDEMVRINKLELTFETSEFRAYSRAIKGGGAIVGTTEAGGSSSPTSSSGGGVVRTTASGGGTSTSTLSGGGVAKSTASGGGRTETSAAGGNHKHLMFQHRPAGSHTGLTRNGFYSGDDGGASYPVNIESYTGSDLWTFGASGNHTHSFNIPTHTHEFTVPTHTHDFTVPNHSHEFTVPAHTHKVDIPAHTHEINLPDHAHEIEHGIYKLASIPSRVTIKVDGSPISLLGNSADSLDLIPYLRRDSNERVTRGWHEVEITPNGLGRIHAQLMSQFFIQSRGGVDV